MRLCRSLGVMVAAAAAAGARDLPVTCERLIEARSRTRQLAHVFQWPR
jgi:hypothetical protein